MTILITADGLEEVVAGDVMYWDEQWMAWEWRTYAKETISEQYTYQRPAQTNGVFLYRHTHPYLIAQIRGRFTLHSGGNLQVSETDNDYVLWNGTPGEKAWFKLLGKHTFDRYYQSVPILTERGA